MSNIIETVDQRTKMVGENRLELLLFQLENKQYYGINVFKVREVLQCPEITELPKKTSSIRGMTHIRGETIPILDMSEAIGRKAISQEEERNCYLIVSEYNMRTIAFLVRAVHRILNTNWNQINSPPAEIGSDNYLTAVMEYEGALVQIIDVEQILADIYPAQMNVSKDIATEAVKELNINKRILIADDSSVARKQMEKSLSDLGYSVVAANNGKDAWDLLEKLIKDGINPVEYFSLIISDIEMPEMDGYTLTSKIKNDNRLKDMYVIMHSSLSGGFNESMVQKVKANDFLPKFKADALANAVIKRESLIK